MFSNNKHAYQLLTPHHSSPLPSNIFHRTFSSVSEKLFQRKAHSFIFVTFLLLIVYIALLSVSISGRSDSVFLSWDIVEGNDDSIRPDRSNVSRDTLLKLLHQCEHKLVSGGFANRINVSTNDYRGTTEAEILLDKYQIVVNKTSSTVSTYSGTTSTPSWAPISTAEHVSCRIPRLNPFDPDIKHLIKNPKPINCEDAFPLLFTSTSQFTITPAKIQQEMEKVGPCCYQTLRRSTSAISDDGFRLSENCYPIDLVNSTEIPEDIEFIAIQCENFGKQQDTLRNSTSTSKNSTMSKIVDMHAFVPIKPKVEKRIEKFKLEKSSNASIGTDNENVNVVILGIDGVSHMNFLRIMPQSYNFLMHNLSAIEMNGVNKIGDNTFPNIAAVLTSQTTTNNSIPCESHKAFDKCPLIWKKYAENGFRTVFGEDATWMGIFNYVKQGFIRVPTDYYFRPFGVAAEKYIGTHRRLNANECYGPKLQFEVLLDYMKKLALTMGSSRRYFQLLWSTSLTHDYLNEGKLGDAALLSTLKWYQEEERLNKTMFILMSDHGIRWGDILEYPVGKLEERLPFLFFVAPSWLEKKHSRAFQSLRNNRFRLTTPYDLHETLNDLVNLKTLRNDEIEKRETALSLQLKNSSLPQGISQFLPIPTSRTCKMAGVPDHYCTCHKVEKLVLSSPVVQQAANYAVHYINLMVAKNSQCAFLALSAIKSAQISKINTDFKIETTYQISFKTTPGNASFDASLVRNNEGFWGVSGTISRTNLYGNQSSCANDKDLKLYCLCIDYKI